MALPSPQAPQALRLPPRALRLRMGPGRRRRRGRGQCHPKRHVTAVAAHTHSCPLPSAGEWPRMRHRSPHAGPASRAHPGRRGAHPAPHSAPRERTRVGLGDACFSTASPAVRTTSTMRYTEQKGFGLSPARVWRRSVMKNSASTSCGSFKISFYTDPTEANSSPLNLINWSARLCLLSLLGADGVAFAILRARLR